MKKMITFSLFLIALSAFTVKNRSGLQVGEHIEDFSLKNIDGKMVSLKNYQHTKGVIVVFTCNHCPYAKAYEQRINDINLKYRELGYPVLAINPNSGKNNPEDSFEGMQKRAKESDFSFPYLHDQKQEVAHVFGAIKTPHVFLLEKTRDNKWKLVYTGAIDDNHEFPDQVNEKYLENAIKAVNKNETPNPQETNAIGCSIKWVK